MTEGRFPNVLYIGPSVPAMLLDQTHLALWRLTDMRTWWVQNDRIDRLRSNLIQRSRSSGKGPTPSAPTRSGANRALLRLPSLALHNALQRLDISSLGAMKYKPDLIMVTEVYRRLEGLKKLPCPKAFYVQDPHLGIERYFDLAHILDFDFVFVRQQDYIPKLREMGCQHVFWLPESFDPDVILGPSGVRDLPVTFIGNRNPGTERERMLNMLEKRFGGINPLAYSKTMASILRHSKIVFNTSRAGDLNNRVFDAMGAGAMLVTDRIQNGLFELFEDKVHLVSYSDIEELEESVKYYLANDREREKVAEAGHREVMSKHSSLDRASFVIKTCLGEKEFPNVGSRFQELKQEVLAKSVFANQSSIL